MKMKDVQAKARSMGLQSKGMKKVELVRTVQAAEDNPACYATATIEGCDQLDCCWRDDCAKMYKRQS